MLPSIESLVKYETPILVSSAFITEAQQKHSRNDKKQSAYDLAPLAGFKEKGEDFLNQILPPQEIIDNS